MPDLIVFHYHLLTGGVTSVIRKGISAIRRHLPEVRGIRLVTGQNPASRAFPPDLGVQVETLSEIGYLNTTDSDPRQPVSGAGALAERLEKEYGSESAVWWVHNFHLGKNPRFTEALLRIIHSGFPQRMILQIHDFPEHGRLPALQALNRGITLPLYPDSPYVHYAVINGRDRRILIEAGLPEERVTLLPNPVNGTGGSADGLEESGTQERRQALRRALSAAFPSRSTSFLPEAPMLFYPVRTIRRKNVLEAGLIARLFEEPVNLLVNLPGLSRQEVVYSGLVEQCFGEGLIPGLWGIGEELEQAGLSFEQTVRASDLVISSAVQEGFGYLFINSLQWGLPLVARDLDILEGVRELFAGYPACFYDRFLCPLTRGDRDLMRGSYRRKLQRLSELLPPEQIRELRRGVGELFRDELFEFSYLSSEVQYRVLKMTGSRSGLDTLRAANRELLGRVADLLTANPVSRNGKVQERFGAHRFARELRGILRALDRRPPGGGPALGGPASADAAQVVRRFARLDALRLLYD